MGEIIVLAAIATGTLINTLAIIQIKKSQTELFRCFLVLTETLEKVCRNREKGR